MKPEKREYRRHWLKTEAGKEYMRRTMKRRRNTEKHRAYIRLKYWWERKYKLQPFEALGDGRELNIVD